MIRRPSNRNASGKKLPRFGSAVVELALVLPVIVLIVFGSIEANNAIYLQQVLTEVAYQGALEGVDISSTEQNVVDRMQDYIDQTSFTGVTFGVVGTDLFIEDIVDERFQFLLLTVVRWDHALLESCFWTHLSKVWRMR